MQRFYTFQSKIKTEKIDWYLNRLSKMPFLEIPYRVKNKLQEQIDKRKTFHYAQCLNPIKGSIYILSDHVDTMKIKNYLPGSKQKILEQANKYMQNCFDIFGIKADFENKIAWHQDPKTKKTWPKQFWTDIEHRDGITIGGAKFVWEVNRFYFLPILGLAFKISGEQKYADKILRTIREWQEDNHYPVGINWTSGIELSLRIANLTWGLSFIKDFQFSKEDEKNINNFIYFHARHLYRYPSKYSSNNNHAIAEAFGLFSAGTYFPYLDSSKKWFKFGKDVLEREAKRQIMPDGGSFEYTTTYLSFVFDFFLLFRTICEKNNITYDSSIDERLERSCDFIYTLMDRSGNIPNIGDQDSAVLVNFGLSNWENFKSILNTGAILYDRPEFLQDNFPDFKTYLLIGDKIKLRDQTNGIHKISNLNIRKNNADRISCKLFEDSGVVVIRDIFQDSEIIFVGNAMPLGMPPLYAHGHLDALSFTLSIDGMEIFIDPGTYLYHSGGKWRKYFRSTAAHNTIRINGVDFSKQIADFMFGKPYKITENRINESGGKIKWIASHDAYQRLQSSVFHTRRLSCLKGKGGFEINDVLSSNGNYTAEQFFHFHPECKLKNSGNEITVKRGNVSIKVQVDERLTVERYRGSEAPLLGWYSREFNHLEETNTLVCSASFNGETILNSTIQLQ